MQSVKINLIGRKLSRFVFFKSCENVRTCHNNIAKYEAHKLSTEERWSKKVTPVEPLPILSSQVPSPSYVRPVDDSVLKSISHASDIHELLDVVNSKCGEMEEEHLVRCFRRINLFQKNKKNFMKTEDLHHQEDFIKLCARLRKIAPTFAVNNNLISCLKALIFLNVWSDSKIIQTLLHNLRTRINSLTLQELTFFSFLLTRMEGPLVEALKLSLPIVSESQLDTQLSDADLVTSSKLLEFYSKKGVMPSTQSKVVSHLMKFSNEEWPSVVACDILNALSDITMVKELGAIQLLSKAMHEMSQHVGSYRPTELVYALSKCATHYSWKRTYWFSEELCKAVAEQVVKGKWKVEDAYSIALNMAKFKFFSPDLLEYFAKEFIDSNLIGLRGNSDFTCYVIKLFSQSNYLPATFEAIKKELLSPENVNKVSENEDPIRWLTLAFNCAVLGVYDQKIISTVFDERFLKKEMSLLDMRVIDELHSAVRLEFPEYSGPFPDSSFINKSRQLFQPVQSPMVTQALSLALGNEKYALNGLFTKWGHYIDHVMVAGPDGNFLELDPEVKCVDDLTVPEGCKLILLKMIQPHEYFVNTDRMLGIPAMKIRTLERTGHNVIALNCRTWLRLHRKEQIPYLTQLIRLKLSEIN